MARPGRKVAPGSGAGGDQDARAGEGADADVLAVDLDGRGAVGRRGRDLTLHARYELGLLEELEQTGSELELLGDPGHGEVVADAERVEGHRVGRLVARAGDRVAVGAGGGFAEELDELDLD